MPREIAELTDLQMELLRVLWARGEGSAAEVAEALRPGRKLATTTVATVLTRLEARGIVEHRVEGRAFVYRAVVAEGEVQRSLLGRVKDAFAGDVTALFAQLLSEHEVDAADLARVRQMIQAKERELEERGE